jgi:phage shock protein E|tara:strand:+ start:1548 stop:1862 length:315 start_codon:yes stop_codon:yes gene_type:complete
MLATALLYLAACANGAKSMIIDVRTIEEWNAGHLASAQHLQLELVASNITELATDKDQPIYLYCRSGNRSGQAKTILEGLGYSQVTNAGGLGEASELLTEQIIQ